MESKKTVNFEVVVYPDEGCKSMFDPSSYITTSNVHNYIASSEKSIEVARKLQHNGIVVHHIGKYSISASCDSAKFEEFFSTKIRKKRPPKGSKTPKGYYYESPGKEDKFEVPKTDNLDNLIEKAYIQHDPIFFADERPIPPFWDEKFRLNVPDDVAQIMQASSVHRQNITGQGVKVVMPDTGFYHHPYFREQGYNFLSVPSPDTVDHTTDNHGHGTGECANLFATAPGINFIGVKMGSAALAFKTGVELNPHIMTNSWGYSVDVPGSSMPNWLKPLHLAVLDAVSRGIIVCFSAGNGHYGFPGSMPEVISVGGVVVDKNLKYSATKYTSGFMSTWFPGRQVPDICGLCGVPPSADYIILPVQQGAALEKEKGWGAFSGTSAASPMVAGVCALMKEANPNLTPTEAKSILKYTARDILTGTNAHGATAGPGPDGATGHGLVDASRALGAIN